jgi:hypothetical protein
VLVPVLVPVLVLVLVLVPVLVPVLVLVLVPVLVLVLVLLLVALPVLVPQLVPALAPLPKPVPLPHLGLLLRVRVPVRPLGPPPRGTPPRGPTRFDSASCVGGHGRTRDGQRRTPPPGQQGWLQLWLLTGNKWPRMSSAQHRHTCAGFKCSPGDHPDVLPSPGTVTPGSPEQQQQAVSTILVPCTHYKTVSLHGGAGVWATPHVKEVVGDFCRAASWVSNRGHHLFGEFMRVLLATWGGGPFAVPASVFARLRTWARRCFEVCNPHSPLYRRSLPEVLARGGDADSDAESDAGSDSEGEEEEEEGEEGEEAKEVEATPEGHNVKKAKTSKLPPHALNFDASMDECWLAGQLRGMSRELDRLACRFWDSDACKGEGMTGVPNPARGPCAGQVQGSGQAQGQGCHRRHRARRRRRRRGCRPPAGGPRAPAGPWAWAWP